MVSPKRPLLHGRRAIWQDSRCHGAADHYFCPSGQRSRAGYTSAVCSVNAKQTTRITRSGEWLQLWQEQAREQYGEVQLTLGPSLSENGFELAAHGLPGDAEVAGNRI